MSEPEGGWGGGILPYINHIGMYRPKGKVSVSKRVYTFPILVWNRVWFSGKLQGFMIVFVVSMAKSMRMKEQYANSKRILRNLLLTSSSVSND